MDDRASNPAALRWSYILVLALSAAVLLPGLGGWARLSYHEAFVAQGAREMLDSGDWSFPTIGGRPWLEKPPLPWWLVVATGRVAGGVDATVARLPSAVAAALMALGVASIASRHYGTGLGLIAGIVQVTTAWTAIRGRLAEADIVLACLVTWAFDALDRTIEGGNGWRRARWAFFVLLGLTSTVKGIGFGAVLIVSAALVVLLWRRDRPALVRLRFPSGWFATILIALAWPVAMIARHGFGALALWTMHITDRLSSHPTAFAGEPWWEYLPGLLVQTLPWTPLAIVGAWHSLRRAANLGPTPRPAIPTSVIAGDRLLWAWSAVPLLLLSLATVKNAHYAIAAQIPWSIWAALGLSRLGHRLSRRGWTPARLRRAAIVGFAGIGLAWGLGFAMLGPWLDRRGIEWAFYESAGRRIPAGAPVALLYDDWDRNPYESPFGAFPHDLAVRLFYLEHPAIWYSLGQPTALAEPSPMVCDFIIGRDRDRPALERMGRVDVVARGPSLRSDRTYAMFQITTRPEPVAMHASGDNAEALVSSSGREHATRLRSTNDERTTIR